MPPTWLVLFALLSTPLVPLAFSLILVDLFSPPLYICFLLVVAFAYNDTPHDTTPLLTAQVIFVAPVVGLAIDHIGFGLIICTFCGVLTSLAYYLLLYTAVRPVVGILLISVGEGIIPTITSALIPGTIPVDALTSGFGVITTLDNLLNFCMDVVFGELFNITGAYDIGLLVLFILSIVGTVLLVGCEYMDVMGARRSRYVAYDRIL